jgi:outer membrane biosynthesis protein TonB
MKKLCYLLSIVIHALLLLGILNTRFLVTIRRDPPRVVVVRVMEPPPPYYNGDAPSRTSDSAGQSASNGTNAAANSAPGGAKGAAVGTVTSRGSRPFPAASAFSLQSSPAGTFRLAPVGRTPEPWAVPLGTPPASRLQGYRPDTFRPATGGANAGSGNLLLPFDMGEEGVADWANAVLARIERNWIIPTAGRLAFSGRVQITLTIERQGSRRSLVIDDASVPRLLTLAALHAIEASLPLPAIPENVAGESLAFTFIFSYNG